IPEDFYIATAGMFIQVPAGAEYLFLSPDDAYFTDNRDVPDPSQFLHLQISKQIESVITPLRVRLAQADVHPNDDVDAPIVPQANSNILSTANLLLGDGLVADGVTPVLFKITATPGNYTAELKIEGAGVFPHPLFY